ncbi:fatty acyl-AMP ligase [Crocosphaera watsonii]|uniref:Long-chain-fatty-acid--CoA ligase n=3 Tax=Crocosphaera watsonii TaxID=263511 RepID=T2JN38_CROWT|nr:fatty acyl-AMP ligase [Crocosphaera watsonii]EHJ12932.1 Long-chain-fatty-acid--CoA ligase [Crocosphaera watsonii WH 0003]CCQ58245.1 Long-chain-fatty-acid--CoA ligase [Crocosphaera watsonii WH 0005]CCQ65957.1 Long-chain-fatty-acid--CoA ligase [Crocosphaera watsonii WH 0402]
MVVKFKKVAPSINYVSDKKPINEFSNLVDLLRWRAINQPTQKAYTFLKHGKTELDNLTYQKLDLRARNIAAKMQLSGLTGERALLLYPPGLEFISAFFGCLYAGVIPIPLYPPKRNQNLSRLQSVVTNAEAKLALTTQDILKNLTKHFVKIPDFAGLNWFTTDNYQENLAQAWHNPEIMDNSLAFLQYTSGSTGNPKGVMVSHKNLLINSADLDRGWEHDSNSVIVTWLPTFHDMGLIYGVIQPLYKGIPCYMMAPASFLQSPVRWLQAITCYKGTHSAAPNFAYELCARRITPEQKKALDLSSWKMALNGAEPVVYKVLKHFSQAFKPCGFNPTAFCPGYGLAEATLKVTSVRTREKPTIYRVQRDALQENRVVFAQPKDESQQILVGCGYTEIDTQIVIVNPETLTPCAAEEVGEIWISGTTVAQGYWQQTEKTQETFEAYLSDTQEGPFLRTGDLGFLSNDRELFVTGRVKDVIIIRGRNHYPQDIEITVEQCHDAIINHRSAAFTVQVNGQEKLVITAELERRYYRRRQQFSAVPPQQERRKLGDRRQYISDYRGFEVKPSSLVIFDEIITSIKKAVSTHHGLQVHHISLLRVGTIPKTSSGKIQRHACRQGFLDNTLTVVNDNQK